jgi:hypothetical protein
LDCASSYVTVLLFQSLAFIERIRTAPDAWRKCMGWIMKGGDYPENFEFFCLQVIADHALHDYRGTDEELRSLQDFLSYWIQSQVSFYHRANTADIQF